MRTGEQVATQTIGMAVYSIRDLEKLTGIKAHTIRIWEQRYGLIEPARTQTNIRYYTDENLRHLFNIALLNRQGVKISHIAQMPSYEIAAMASEIAESNQGMNTQIDALTLSMIDLDEMAFSRIFNAHISEYGFERTMTELIYPFLDKLNVLWLTGSVNPAHEKFIGNLIRRKLLCAIDKEGMEVSKDSPTFLLFLPENENQELTLLFMHYLLRTRRLKVIYLGMNTSLSDLQSACSTVKPTYVFTVINELPHRQSLQNYVDNLKLAIGDSSPVLTGAQFYMQPVKFPSNSILLNGLQDSIQFLDGLAARKK